MAYRKNTIKGGELGHFVGNLPNEAVLVAIFAPMSGNGREYSPKIAFPMANGTGL